MPKCVKCTKRTFDGTRWNSTTTRKEFSGKYLCHSCYQEIAKEKAQLYSQNPQLQQKNKEMLNTEIESCKSRISNLATLYADGKISENSYITTSKALEDKLKSLESMKANNDYSSFSTSTFSNPSSSQTPPTLTEKPTSMWYMAPIFFALLGGIIGYVAVKDDDKEMANNLLTIGVIMSVVNFFVIWAVYSWLILQTLRLFP